jgi:amidase
MSDTAAGELMFRPVTELAELVRDGSLSARELVENSLRRIEELNPRLNAFVDVDAERALAAADAIGAGDPRPFAGVPIAIKNNRPVAGWRLTYATSLLADNVAGYDHNVTRRLVDAGFIVVGTTTLPELGIVPVSESQLFGPTRNPWDTDRTPGGSSGGSAAAVASGMVPIAHANDGGGSTRIPAACCGLVGLKAQRGRVSGAPDEGDSFLVVDGVLTRTVAESAAVLDVLAGPETGDATWAPPPPEPFAVSAAAHPQRLRIALATVPPLRDAVVHEPGLRAVRDTAELLESLGHVVEEVAPPWQDDDLLSLFTVEFAAAVSAAIAYAAARTGREPAADDVEPLSWLVYQIAKATSSIDALMARQRLQAVARAVISALAPYDALLLPMLAEPPVPIGEIDTTAAEPMQAFVRAGQFTPFSALFNVSGQPAISLPLYESQGLPLAVQLVARPAQEGALLALSAQLEAARPWTQRRPGVS